MRSRVHIHILKCFYNSGAYSRKESRDRLTGSVYDCYRVMANVNIVERPDLVQQVLRQVFANLAMKCVVVRMAPARSPVAEWLPSLRTVENLHFETDMEVQACDASRYDLQIQSLTFADPPLGVPPAVVLDSFPNSHVWLAFDIETHDLAVRTRTDVVWKDGKFGHACRFGDSCLENLRMIQIGWCMQTSANSELVEKQCLIYPADFEVTPTATSKHHITNEDLRRSGKPLHVVLSDFLADVAHVLDLGGTICAHQLEFDAGIVDLELARAGLNMTERKLWENAATHGICTMDPTLTRWSCEIYFEVVGTHSILGRGSPVGLRDMLLALLPHEYQMLKKHHDAGFDAKMTLKLVCEIQRRLEHFEDNNEAA
jgi:DNA polymerase III epsilon subunit-like protein